MGVVASQTPEIRLFVQQIVRTNKNESNKAQLLSSFEGGIQSGVDGLP